MKRYNSCRYCKRKLNGITPCNCKESRENQDLWNTTERRKTKIKKKSKSVTTSK